MVLVMSLLSWGVVFADEPPGQHDYTKEVGEEYIFVMLVEPSFGGHYELNESIRSTYSQSGLYRKNGSPEPLWTIDWYANQVDVSSDGKHMIRWGDYFMFYEQMALEFYENGQLIKSYAVNDLVASPESLPESVTYFYWKKDSSLNDEQKRLHVRTLNREEYTFDITTGEIVMSSSNTGIGEILAENVAVISMVLIGLIIVLVWVYVKYRKTNGAKRAMI